MASDKNVRRFKLPKAQAGSNRRTKKGRKRNTHERFQIKNGAVANASHN